VDYQYDTDRVVALLARVSAELAKDPAFAVVILDGLEVLGVEQLGASTVTIRARLKTVPQKQWDVARELRRRIKKTCEAEGIQLSLPPQRVELLPSHS
jgi:small conductance mechanosensitive channel